MILRTESVEPTDLPLAELMIKFWVTLIIEFVKLMTKLKLLKVRDEIIILNNLFI